MTGGSSNGRPGAGGAVNGADLGDFVAGAVMIILAGRNAAGQAVIGRGVGARIVAEGPGAGGSGLELRVSRALWPELVAAAAPGTPLAATFVQPNTYLCYQFKGIVTAVAPGNDGDQALAARYVAQTGALMRPLGITPQQLACWIDATDLMRISLRLTGIYRQTPGPGAGSALQGDGTERQQA